MGTPSTGAIAPIPFSFNGYAVRVIQRDGEPWFVAADVCDALGYSNSRDAVASHLDDDERGVASSDTLGGKQSLTVISESGLYALVLRSRKPEARKFAKWVTAEVLPAIRKTGSYAEPAASPLGGRRMLMQFDHTGQPTAPQLLHEDALIGTPEQLAQAIAAGGWRFEAVRLLLDACTTHIGQEAARLSHARTRNRS